MEARDRIDRLSTRCLGVNVVESGETKDDRTKRARHSWIEMPVPLLKRSQWAGSKFANPAAFGSAPTRLSQCAKPGAGDSVTNVFTDGTSREMSCATCLIRKLPNDTPFRPG